MADTRDEAADTGKRVYTVAEFLASYGISRTRAYEEIAAGRLQVRRLGRRTLILRDDAEAWLSALPVLRQSSERAA